IVDRPKLTLPGGARMILWPLISLEDWDISRPMARVAIPPPQHQPMLPDVPNWSWHEYGMRVGFWRLKNMFDRLGIKPTVTLNAKVCLNYPRVAAGCLESGWEFNAHSFEQIPMHKLEDQRDSIFRTMDVIEKFAGKRPRGWFGPGLTQTFDTPDYLAEAGVEYIGDWVFDDQPVRLTTRHGPLVALPYNFEVHDIVMMLIQNHASDLFKRRALDYFDCIYADSETSARVMAVAMHPYISGSPHRIRYIAETLEHIAGQPGVLVWNGEQILDWYLKERPLDVNAKDDTVSR
ncbi:MAG: polysaccharide deacetylase family protein, partial [Steroidobacteraceae bacterium]